MAKLRYAAITSLDGYVEDTAGRFDWAAPDAELHAFVNDLERPVGTLLYGRRMYETMAVWQTIGLEPDGAAPAEAAPAPEELDFAELWRGQEKVVYSRTLDGVSTPRTRLAREFDPDPVRRLKETAQGDLSVSGPELASRAFAAGLVDEVHLFVHPVAVGGGKRAPGSLRPSCVDGQAHLHVCR